MKASETHRDSYPESYFPQLNLDAERKKILAELGEQPTGVLKAALAEAKKNVDASVKGLAAAATVRRGA